MGARKRGKGWGPGKGERGGGQEKGKGVGARKRGKGWGPGESGGGQGKGRGPGKRVGGKGRSGGQRKRWGPGEGAGAREKGGGQGKEWGPGEGMGAREKGGGQGKEWGPGEGVGVKVLTLISHPLQAAVGSHEQNGCCSTSHIRGDDKPTASLHLPSIKGTLDLSNMAVLASLQSEEAHC